MNYREVYGKIWNYHKKWHSKIKDYEADEFYMLLLEDGRQLERQFNQHPLVVDLIVAVIEELQRVRADNAE